MLSLNATFDEQGALISSTSPPTRLLFLLRDLLNYRVFRGGREDWNHPSSLWLFARWLLAAGAFAADTSCHSILLSEDSDDTVGPDQLDTSYEEDTPLDNAYDDEEAGSGEEPCGLVANTHP